MSLGFQGKWNKTAIILVSLVSLLCAGCSSSDDGAILNSRVDNGVVIFGSGNADDRYKEQKNVKILSDDNQLALIKPKVNDSEDETPGDSSSELFQLDKPYASMDGEYSESLSGDKQALKSNINILNKYLLSILEQEETAVVVQNSKQNSRQNSKRRSKNTGKTDRKIATNTQLNIDPARLKMLMDEYSVDFDSIATPEQLQKFSLYVRGAMNKNPNQQSELADFYLDGIAGQSYPELAVSWYLVAASNNSAYAKYMLSILYQEGIGLPQNLEKSVAWYQKASNSPKSTEALVNIAKRYANPTSFIHNKQAAALWMETAAMRDSIEAQYLLGDMYARGNGVKKSGQQALQWYKKAAAKGSAYAQYSLGVLYYNGDGVEQNLLEAEKWLTYAAFQKNSEAQYLLAKMYEHGLGVQKDLAKAYAFWKLIPRDSMVDQNVEMKLSKLITDMTPQQRAQAKDLTVEYSKKSKISKIG